MLADQGRTHAPGQVGSTSHSAKVLVTKTIPFAERGGSVQPTYEDWCGSNRARRRHCKRLVIELRMTLETLRGERLRAGA
jgi:hypothetical protein